MARNVLNPTDMDDELFIDRSQLFVSKKTRHGWKGVRSLKGAYLNRDSIGGMYFECIIGRGLGVCRVGFSLGIDWCTLRSSLLFFTNCSPLDISETSRDLGSDDMSWGFGGTGKRAHKGEFVDYGEGFSDSIKCSLFTRSTHHGGVGYTENDVIGSYCQLNTGKIFFFKNGECLGLAFQIPLEYLIKGCHKVYPTIALRESGVRANFGKSAWICPPKFSVKRAPVARDPSIKLNFNPNQSQPIKKTVAVMKDTVDRISGLPSEMLMVLPPLLCAILLIINVFL